MMTPQRKSKQKANEVDVFLGKKLKFFRKMRGLSQGKVASQLDLTFQQFQKYESGRDRVSASKIYGLAKILNVDIKDFFEGLEDTSVVKPLTEPGRLATFDKETIELLKVFQSISDPKIRKSVLVLLTKFVEET